MAETTPYAGSASKIVSSEYLFNTLEDLKENIIDQKADASDLTTHISNNANPHNVTKAQVGLGNAENTKDADKNVATAVKATKDASGNVITTTYGNSLSVSGKTVTLKSKSGAVLSTITTQDTTYSNASTTASGLMTSDMVKKLNGIAAGAEVNVNADWNATTGDAMILNKPSIPTVVFESTALDLTALT